MVIIFNKQINNPIINNSIDYVYYIKYIHLINKPSRKKNIIY